MNLKARAEMVRAMDLLVRSVNDESYVDPWLVVGVADGDITENTTDEDLENYCEDDDFVDLMTLFLKIMIRAGFDGGIVCDKASSKQIKVREIRV